MNSLTRSAAEELYARVWEVCHSPRCEDGRTTVMGVRDPSTTDFQIKTRFGRLEVTVIRPRLNKLIRAIQLRFLESTDVPVEVDAADYDKATGRWNVEIDMADPYASVDILERRLNWAQGLPTLPQVQQMEMTQEFAFHS